MQCIIETYITQALKFISTKTPLFHSALQKVSKHLYKNNSLDKIKKKKGGGGEIRSIQFLFYTTELKDDAGELHNSRIKQSNYII